MENHQKQNFEERVARLGAQNSGQNSSKRGKPSGLRKASNRLVSIFAFLIGLSAVVLARYVRYRLEVDTLTGESADAMMLMDIGIGVAVGLLVKIVFRVKSLNYYSAMIAGVLLSVVLMHNLVHKSSDVFRTYFSPQWTEMIIENTKPNSVLFRGISYTMSDMMSGQNAEASKTDGETPDVKVNELPQVR